MLHNIIQEKKNKWLQSDDCTISDLIKYIRDKGQLRDTQIEAIETYLKPMPCLILPIKKMAKDCYFQNWYN